jgi:CubicO group peptidase (beta-lactamase class C family)
VVERQRGLQAALVGFVLVVGGASGEGGVSPGRGDGAVTPASVEGSATEGFTAEGLAHIQRMMDDAVAAGRVSAAISALALDGRIVWLGTAGEMAPGVPMRDDAILPLASVGKMFTATAVMILVDRGVVSLDDPVARYIPEFDEVTVELADPSGEVRRVAPDRPITVYHLLTHTGGLTVTGDAFWAAWDANSGKTTTTHLARDLAALPLFAQPGERFEYGQTGASYEVLGAVVEIASGQTLERFLAESLFEPLGLPDSFFFVPVEKADRLPAVYRRVDGTLQLDRAHGADFPRSTFFHGGGGVRSSARDLVRFSRLFLEGGAVDGVRILRPETVDLMMRDHAGELVPERWRGLGRGWGFGAAVVTESRDDGSERVRQYGWAGGGFARLWVDPEARLTAYFNVPLTPPGDFDLLDEFERRVGAARAR